MMITDQDIFEANGELLKYNKYTLSTDNFTAILFSSKNDDGDVVSVGYDNIYLLGKFAKNKSKIKIWVISHVAFWPNEFCDLFYKMHKE